MYLALIYPQIPVKTLKKNTFQAPFAILQKICYTDTGGYVTFFL